VQQRSLAMWLRQRHDASLVTIIFAFDLSQSIVAYVLPVDAYALNLLALIPGCLLPL